MRIKDRTIVVTGASRGIGKATSQALTRAGARVAMLARSPEIAALAGEITAQGGVARGYVVDLADHAAVERVARRIEGDLGAPDIIINNAGAGRWLYVEETAPAEMVSMMAAPYFAAFSITRAFLPAMLARGDGMIVNVNSPAAWLPWPGATGYLAARWAMRGLTQGLRMDLRGTGIRVLEVVPGEVTSTYFENNPGTAERLPWITKWVPTSTPAAVAAGIVRGIERDRRTVIMPFMLRLVVLSRALMPPLVDWVMWRTGWRRSRKG